MTTTLFDHKEADTGTSIVVAATRDPGIVLLDTEKFDAFYDGLRAKAPADADVATKKGRDALRSYAADVRSQKAAINKARLRLTEEWRGMVKQANDAGKVIDERLEALAVEVRKPLTEWEEAEKARETTCRDVIASIKAAAVVSIEDTAATVRERGMLVWEHVLDEDTFRDMLPEAQAAKEQAVEALKAALARLTKEEADRAELERLRAEAAERERVEAEKRAAEEAERQRAEEVRLAEERRIAAERAEAERIERERREAAEQAQREAERKAQEERDAERRRHEEELAAERRRSEEIERAAQAERDRIAAAEEARRIEETRIAEEQAERERNKAHRTRVKRAAKEAIMTCGASEETAQKIVIAIIAGEVPAVTLRF